MASISNSLSGNSLLTYLQNMSARAQAESAGQGALTTDAKGVSASMATALQAAGRSLQSSAQQTSLDKQQASLAAELRSAMAKAGIQLSGDVGFAISSSGKLEANGSDSDKAMVDKFLAADTSNTSFLTRITKLTTDAEALSTNIKQAASISQAARYASSAAGVVSLYEALNKQQDATPATFTLSGTNSSLTYPGVLASNA